MVQKSSILVPKVEKNVFGYLFDHYRIKIMGNKQSYTSTKYDRANQLLKIHQLAVCDRLEGPVEFISVLKNYRIFRNIFTYAIDPDPSRTFSNPRPLIHQAILQNNMPLILTLLETCDINRVYKYFTPLCLAITLGNIETVKVLLTCSKIDVNFKNPLNVSIQKQHDDITKLLLNDPRVDLSSGTSLWCAIQTHNIEITKLFLEDPRVDPNFGHPFLGAILTKNVQIAKMFLKHPQFEINCRYYGYNRIETGNNYLQAAAMSRSFGILKLLINHPDIDPHSFDNMQTYMTYQVNRSDSD